MKRPLFWFTLLGLLGSLPAADPVPAPAVPEKSGRFVFHALPKSLQANPEVDFNVITEMTDEGRKAPQASPAAPIYYRIMPDGFVQLGSETSAGEKPPTVERLQRELETSMTRSGYIRAGPGHPPAIVILYTWGSHSSPMADNTVIVVHDSLSPEHRRQVDDLLDRARLVGGDKFAKELTNAMAEEGRNRSNGSPKEFDLLSPIERLRRRSGKIAGIMEDTAGSVYFMVASAYTFASAATDNKILLWRTKMTVNSSGVAMGDTLLPLITAAGPYFGKDMSEVEVLTARIYREGTVKLGPLEVKEYDPKAPPPAGEKKP